MTPQLFTTTDGINCRLKNPYLKPKADEAHPQALHNPEWHKFEASVKTYPIHSDKPIEAGDFSGDLVNQLFSPTIGWINETEVNDLTKHLREKRTAVQPVPVKGEGKVEYDYISPLEEMIRCFIRQEHLTAKWEAFIGTHALSSSNLVELERVVEVLENEKQNIQSAHHSCPVRKSKYTYNYGIKVLTNVINQLKSKYEKE